MIVYTQISHVSDTIRLKGILKRVLENVYKRE